MMKAPPRAAFEVIQSQIIFGALKVLLNVPARAAQFQAAGLVGRLMKMRQVIMVGLRSTGGPVDDQPDPFQFSVRLAQPFLQKHLPPTQTGLAGFAIGRLPRTTFPFAWGDSLGQLGQGSARRSCRAEVTANPFHF